MNGAERSPGAGEEEEDSVRPTLSFLGVVGPVVEATGAGEEEEEEAFEDGETDVGISGKGVLGAALLVTGLEGEAFEGSELDPEADVAGAVGSLESSVKGAGLVVELATVCDLAKRFEEPSSSLSPATFIFFSKETSPGFVISPLSDLPS